MDTDTHYVIRIKGYLDDRWLRWFEGISVSQMEYGDTLTRVRTVEHNRTMIFKTINAAPFAKEPQQ